MAESRSIGVVVVLVVCTTSARAEWRPIRTGSGNRHLIGVCAPDPVTIYAAGFHLDTSGMFPVPVAHAFKSTDGGRTLVEVTSNLGAGMSMWLPTCITFFDAQTGWVGGGSTIYRTTDGGANWSGVDIGTDVGTIHFFSATNGIAVGEGGTFKVTNDGGAHWTDAPGPETTIFLRSMLWLDYQRGWIAGYDEREEEDFDGNVTTVNENARIFFTNDGGATWSASNLISDRGLGTMFFLPDGQTGFVTAWKWLDATRTEPFIYRTTDGGLSFEDMHVPTSVGTMSVGGMSIPIGTSAFVTMHWTDALNGHLGGTALVGNAAAGNESEKIYRTVDYLTEDGGTTWSRTDLGTINASGESENDGQLTAGAMRSFYDGVMVGEKSTVWGYEWLCGSAADCPPGYACTGTSTCVPPPAGVGCTPACDAGRTCQAGACVDTTTSDQESSSTTGDFGSRTSGRNDPATGGTTPSSGCNTTGTTSGLWALFGLLVLMGWQSAKSHRPLHGCNVRSGGDLMEDRNYCA